MNLPNKISLGRIIAMPLFLLFFLLDFTGSKFIALGLFVLAIISDAVDGHIARKYNMVTNLGKFLDTIADKILATTGVIILIVGANPIIPHPYGTIFMFIMILRDYAVTALRQIAQLKNVIIPADKMGKIKANFIYATLIYGLLIASLNDFEKVATSAFMKYFNIVFYVLVGVTTFFIILSGVMYIVKHFGVFLDDEKDAKVEKIENKTAEEDETKSEEAPSTETLKVEKKPSTKKSTTKKTTAKK